MSDERDFEVGYGKPPRHRQFKKGAPSPNPRGRPKNSKNSATLVREALFERVALRGRSKKVSKLELSLMQLANKAASGDLKAIQIVIGLYREVEAHAAASSQEKPLDAADREILDMLLAQMRAAREGDSA